MIKAYLRTTVTKKEPIINASNELTGYNDTDIKARWTKKNKLIDIEGGKQVVSTNQILILDQTIDNTYKIKYDNIEYAVIAINECKDFSVRCLEIALE